MGFFEVSDLEPCNSNRATKSFHVAYLDGRKEKTTGGSRKSFLFLGSLLVAEHLAI